MPYLGKSPSQGVRTRFQFTPNAGTTSISGADANGLTLSFTDGNYVDVYLNGVMLKAGVDYNTTTANQVTLSSGTVASDVVDIVVYDTFSLFGGTLEGNVKVNNGTFNVTGAVDFDSTLNVDGVVTTDGATHDGDVTFTGANYNAVWDKSDNALEFGDNAKAKFGTGGDLEIYHNGSNSLIADVGTGTLILYGDTEVAIKDPVNGEAMATFIRDGAAELYYNNVKKLETTSSGVTVTGTTYSSLNLGIRISSPAYNLHVHQDDSDASYALFTNTTTGTTANDGFRIGIDSNEDALIWHREAENIIFATSNDEKMRIDPNGDIFIGTSSDIAPTNGTNLYISDGTVSRFGLEKTGSNARKFSIGNGGTYLNIYDETADEERMRIDSSGRVGINASGDGTIDAMVYSSGQAVLQYGASYLSHLDPDGSGALYLANNVYYNGSNNIAKFYGYTSDYYQSSGNHIWRSSGITSAGATASLTERMRITSSGNVGIGSSNSEEYPLFIKGSNISSGGGLAALCILDSGTAYNGTNPGGGITFRGKYNNGGSTTNFATVQGIKENTTDGNYATALRFTTRANGGNLTERLRLASDGRVYTCDTQSGDPHRYHVNNRVSIAPNGSKTHTITGMSQGYVTLKLAYSDGNAQYAHVVVELGGSMYSSSNGYNATVVANSASTMSVSITKNNASYVVTVNAGSNYAYGSFELSGGAFNVSSPASYAFS